MAMMAVMDQAARFVRAGNGPVIVEAHTYRIEAHTNADDATRYRESDEVELWRARDPITRLERYLRAQGRIDDQFSSALTDEANAVAAEVREAMNRDRQSDPRELFAYVYARPTSQLEQEQADIVAELSGEDGGGP
jgi:pyruvate dehydrogenase E1 component alpha subunit